MLVRTLSVAAPHKEAEMEFLITSMMVEANCVLRDVTRICRRAAIARDDTTRVGCI